MRAHFPVRNPASDDRQAELRRGAQNALHSALHISAQGDSRDGVWCVVKGSPWEAGAADGAASLDRETGDDRIRAAFRQIKYELFCASVDLLGFSLDISPNRNCRVRPAYFLTEEESTPHLFEFVYDHASKRYSDIIWSDHAQEYADLFRYWVLERHCVPGFLAEVFLHLYAANGSPPPRKTAPE